MTGLERAALRLAPGRHVAVTWSDPNAAPLLLLRALAAGAAGARVVAPDWPADPDAWLRRAAARHGLEEEAERVLAAEPCRADVGPRLIHSETQRPRSWWLRADPSVADIRNLVAPADVAVDGIVLGQYERDPGRRLRIMAGLGARWLVLNVPVLLPSPTLAAVGFTAEAFWHAPLLAPAQWGAVDAHLRTLNLALPQFATLSPGFSRAEGVAIQPDLWWWFMGEAGLERLLECEGWRLRRLERDGAHAVATAERA